MEIAQLNLAELESDGIFNRIMVGDARKVLLDIPEESVDLSLWSPPYFVGKSYERNLSFEDWQSLIDEVIASHWRIIKPGGFLAVNINDILCFQDPSMPKYQADNVRRKRSPVTRLQVLEAQKLHPDASRKELGSILGCSEQTVQRRLENNNVRGGKNTTSTRILLTGMKCTQWAESAGFYLYDRRIWHKDPCWANCRWHANSYRAVDEFEYIYVFWKPGIVEYDRERLSESEWAQWGSRGVWSIRSVSRNNRHEAEFPEELASRIIRLYSPENGVVIDPFLGSGTTTAVAKRLKRRWLGIESDAAYARLASERTNSVS